MIVMAAPRCLGAADAHVVLWSFAAGHCKSYWSACIKVATFICQQIFSGLALAIFPLKILLKRASDSSFFALAPRSGFGFRTAISGALATGNASLCNSFSV